MRDTPPLFVIVAHQDDWQLFMGKEVFARIREGRRIVIVVTTAGDAGDERSHWTSRLSGLVLSVLRAFPAWSPYPSEATAGYRVAYDTAALAGKTALRVTLDDAAQERAALYLLHLPDGGSDGAGFAPRGQSLKRLHEGEPLSALWPEGSPSTYHSWAQFETTLAAIVERERAGGTDTVRVYAADPDAQRNPGDHADHTYTSLAVAALAERDPSIEPIWFATYAIAARDANLAGDAADDQRAAIFAYGGGYSAAAAGFGETWRTGWEREYPHFKGRQYPADTGNE